MFTPLPFRRVRAALAACLFSVLAPVALAQGKAATAAPAVKPVVLAGELRSLSQRLAKLRLQSSGNINGDYARRELERGLARFDDVFARLAAAPAPDSAARSLKRVTSQWTDFRSVLGVAAAPADRVSLGAEEVAISLGKLALQYESGEDSPVWRLVDLARRNNMLAQRLGRLYFQARLGDKSEGLKVDIETTRKEFATSLGELERAPQTSSGVKNSLALARQQWSFFEAAVVGNEAGERAAAHVATTSERIGEMMDEISAAYVRDLGR